MESISSLRKIGRECIGDLGRKGMRDVTGISPIPLLEPAFHSYPSLQQALQGRTF
jgi:hypothetical protein